ncbi:MAG: radical SAM protein [Chloroflexi bacterium]|nr:radical SAM protein [Chloroflexota bacterium]
MSYHLRCAVWEFTLRCNLRCSHCGSAAGAPRTDELSTQECFKLCEELAKLGCEDVCLMGGEPFLRDDWPSVAQCIKTLGMNLSFVSNGTVLDRHIDLVARLRPKVVGISLDGAEERHELIRGADTFRKAVGAIELLRQRDIPTTAITTVSKANFRDLPKIRDLLFRKGVNWQIQVAMPFGNFGKEQMLSTNEFYATALFIARERTTHRFADLPLVGADCYGYYSKFLPDGGWKGCAAGISAIGVTSDGGVVGCLAMGNDRFVEGNIRTASLREIWGNPSAFAYNRGFQAKQLGPECRDCKHGAKCHGGCSAMSLTTTGRFHNDPYCFSTIEKQMQRH